MPEELWAYEIGTRGDLTDRASLSVSGYFNQYEHLKTIEFGPPGAPPLTWGNSLEGNVYGVEAWGNYQIADWWRLSAGLDVQQEALRFGPGTTLVARILGVAQAGDDPHHQASLRSSMNLTDSLTLDGDLRYVGVLPDPHVPQYFELNARLGWKVSDRLEISLSGFNLLHPQHEEFTPDASDEIKRSFFLETRWKF